MSDVTGVRQPHRTTPLLRRKCACGGSGVDFGHAECYASFVADLFNMTPGKPECPVT